MRPWRVDCVAKVDKHTLLVKSTNRNIASSKCIQSGDVLRWSIPVFEIYTFESVWDRWLTMLTMSVASEADDRTNQWHCQYQWCRTCQLCKGIDLVCFIITHGYRPSDSLTVSSLVNSLCTGFRTIIFVIVMYLCFSTVFKRKEISVRIVVSFAPIRYGIEDSSLVSCRFRDDL
jgi:hypothetical protein